MQEMKAESLRSLQLAFRDSSTHSDIRSHYSPFQFIPSFMLLSAPAFHLRLFFSWINSRHSRGYCFRTHGGVVTAELQYPSHGWAARNIVKASELTICAQERDRRHSCFTAVSLSKILCNYAVMQLRTYRGFKYLLFYFEIFFTLFSCKQCLFQKSLDLNEFSASLVPDAEDLAQDWFASLQPAGNELAVETARWK